MRKSKKSELVTCAVYCDRGNGDFALYSNYDVEVSCYSTIVATKVKFKEFIDSAKYHELLCASFSLIYKYQRGEDDGAVNCFNLGR
jgi:hypothetical protein